MQVRQVKDRVLGLIMIDDPASPGAASFHPSRASRAPRHRAPRAFRGPFAEGPPAEALQINAPDLYEFGWAELRRKVLIDSVLAITVGLALVGWLLKPRGRTLTTALSQGMVNGFELLGPTFVKLGQLIASTPGLFPQSMADASLRCLDEVAPFDTELVRETVKLDLGDYPEEIFRSFDPVPLSAASVGQVHACVLPDGREAVIKLQRPDAHERMATDLRLAYLLAVWLEGRHDIFRRVNLVEMIEELHATTFQELNCALEAHRLDRFHGAVHAFGDNDWVAVPQVYWDYCGPHMICMERMTGTPLDEFDKLRDSGVDTTLALRRGVKAWMESLMMGEEFHGDVHAGNMWILDDGRTTFLDFGIMGTLPEEWRQLLRDSFYTVMIDGDFTRIARHLKRLGVLDPNSASDEEIALRLQLLFATCFDKGLAQISLADLAKTVIDMSKQYNGSAPREMMLVIKQLMYFERYAKALAPDWVLARDLYLVRNVFPDEVARKTAEMGISLPA